MIHNLKNLVFFTRSALKKRIIIPLNRASVLLMQLDNYLLLQTIKNYQLTTLKVIISDDKTAVII